MSELGWTSVAFGMIWSKEKISGPKYNLLCTSSHSSCRLKIGNSWKNSTTISGSILRLKWQLANQVQHNVDWNHHTCPVQGGAVGFDAGNGKKLISSQARPVRQTAWLFLSFSPFPVLNPAAPLFTPCLHPPPHWREACLAIDTAQLTPSGAVPLNWVKHHYCNGGQLTEHWTREILKRSGVIMCFGFQK